VTDERWLTACHEAGHAVACLMRGGGTFVSITIEPTAQYLGCTQTRIMQWDDQFTSYAGPWAEARAKWPADLPISDSDSDDCYFQEYVLTALMANPLDFQGYRGPIRRAAADHYSDAELSDLDAARDQTWDMELERMWPTMLSVAKLLIDGEQVTAELVRALRDS
jgi:hypothetical protein